MAANQAQAYLAPTANYAYAIVSPNLLSAPEHETLSHDRRPHVMSAFGGVIAYFLV